LARISPAGPTTVEAPRGTAIEIFYSEKRPRGTASVGQRPRVRALQTDYYVARGGGRETWMPRFSTRGSSASAVRSQPHAASAGVKVTLECEAGADGVASTGELGFAADAGPHPSQHAVGDPEQPSRHHHRHARYGRTDGRVMRN
jgi:hypothetical protein